MKNEEYRLDLKEKSLKRYHNRVQNEEGYREKINARQKHYMNNTEVGRFRRFCSNTAKHLKSGKLSSSKLKLLDYTPQKFLKHIINNTGFNSLEDAYRNNYHIDHIVPVWYIARSISNKELQFKVIMDLENLRLIPAEENLRKHNKIDLPIVQETIKFLWMKYSIL